WTARRVKNLAARAGERNRDAAVHYSSRFDARRDLPAGAENDRGTVRGPGYRREKGRALWRSNPVGSEEWVTAVIGSSYSYLMERSKVVRLQARVPAGLSLGRSENVA